MDTTQTREAVIRTAETYLIGGLVDHDPDRPHLAPTCVRHENGWFTGDETQIRHHLPAMTMVRGVRNLRFLVEGNWAVARFDLVLDESYGRTKSVAEWFHVGRAGIEQIEAVFPLERVMDNALGPAADMPDTKRRSVARSQCEAATVALGQRLLAAAPNTAGLPLAPDVVWSENGSPIVHGPEALADAWAGGFWDRSPSARVGQWVAEGSQAIARFQVDTPDGAELAAALYVRSFDGLIREVELLWGLGPSERAQAAWRGRP